MQSPYSAVTLPYCIRLPIPIVALQHAYFRYACGTERAQSRKEKRSSSICEAIFRASKTAGHAALPVEHELSMACAGPFETWNMKHVGYSYRCISLSPVAWKELRIAVCCLNSVGEREQKTTVAVDSNRRQSIPSLSASLSVDYKPLHYAGWPRLGQRYITCPISN